MQPYLFPYIGYFQLINAVDKFIFLDDVNYIKKGWINRNKILLSGQEYLFTIPIEKMSQNKKINEIKISHSTNWQTKFLTSLMHAYKNAPFYKEVIPLIEFLLKKKHDNLSTMIIESVGIINAYLNINTIIEETSSKYNTSNLKAQSKIIEICQQEKAKIYLNPIGGIELYQQQVFLENDIQLKFLKPNAIEYKQYNKAFISGLSIIDVLMFNSSESISSMLNQFTLVDHE